MSIHAYILLICFFITKHGIIFFIPALIKYPLFYDPLTLFGVFTGFFYSLCIHGPQPEGRSWHTASALPHNRMFVYGGFTTNCQPLSMNWLEHLKFIFFFFSWAYNESAHMSAVHYILFIVHLNCAFKVRIIQKLSLTKSSNLGSLVLQTTLTLCFNKCIYKSTVQLFKCLLLPVAVFTCTSAK